MIFMIMCNHEQYAKKLTPEEQMLLTLRDELYDRRHGKNLDRDERWAFMVEDLNTRLNGRPYLFKMFNRIKDDLKRIEKLQEYEKKHGVNLADYFPQ